MKDWRLIGQETFYKNITLRRVKFPDFWKKSYLTKNKFYTLILEDATKFVEKYKRGKEYLEREDIQVFWHTHCDFCTQTITTQDDRECYCTKDYRYWVCKDCFDDFYNFFDWKIELKSTTIRFFYRVIYQKKNKDVTFDLGIFSSLENARKKIAKVSCQIGFKDWINGFQIIKVGVKFEQNTKINKHGLKLFCIFYEYEIKKNEIVYDIHKYFGVFSSLEQAERRVDFLKHHTHGGKKYPNTFEIGEVIVDNDSAWSEGFISF